MRKVKVGIIGCGVICQTYMHNLTEIYEMLEVEAVADIFIEKAKRIFPVWLGTGKGEQRSGIL